MPLTSASLFCIILIDKKVAKRLFLITYFLQYEQINQLHQRVNLRDEKSNLANQERNLQLYFNGCWY